MPATDADQMRTMGTHRDAPLKRIPCTGVKVPAMRIKIRNDLHSHGAIRKLVSSQAQVV